MTDSDADMTAKEPTAGESLTVGEGLRFYPEFEKTEFRGGAGQILCTTESNGCVYMHVKDQKIDLMGLVKTLKELLELVDRLAVGPLEQSDEPQCTCMNHVWRDGGTAACPIHGAW